MKKHEYLYLTGGLGNQLFQLAFGLAWAESDIYLDILNGNPRSSLDGNPDILEFQMPNKVKISNKPKSKLIQRVLGYNLRIGVVPNKLESGKIYLWIIKIISSITLSLYLKSMTVPATARGVGYFDYIPKTILSRYFIGYFQSFRWLRSSAIIDDFRNLQISNPSSNLVSLKRELGESPTLVLHLRLGDYLSEPAFGTISKEYLEEGITHIQNMAGPMRIWGFSDQPDLALQILGPISNSEIRWIGPDELSAAETLDLMRGGSGFILANSTFSWWAATLRTNNSAPVIAPMPWFKSLPEPPDLVPPEWIRLKAF
jgi:hypothetical protein